MRWGKIEGICWGEEWGWNGGLSRQTWQEQNHRRPLWGKHGVQGDGMEGAQIGSSRMGAQGHSILQACAHEYILSHWVT